MKSVITLFAAAILISSSHIAIVRAQTPPPQAAAQSEQLLKAEELDALVSPIALYPDTLLAEVLMASSYPLEVVQAERWATGNKNLKGDELKAAADQQPWDESVKSLTATPEVLTMMSTKLDWTQKLGDAVLAQQADVMDAIQRLRTKAQANNKLASTPQQKVSVKQEQSKQVIVIEPTQPDTVYVPYYDPAVVYGTWPYPAYPPYVFPAPGYIAGGLITTGLAFGAGYAVGRWASGGNYWGGGLNWGGNNINVNRSIDVNNVNVKNWTHNAEHRHGVRYYNNDVRAKFGNNDIRAGNQARMDYRGKGGEQVLRPGGDRPGGDRPGGDRPGGAGIGDRTPGGANLGDRTPGSRPDAGTRDRPNAGNRPAGGERPGGANRPQQRDNAFSNVQQGKRATQHADRGRASIAAHQGGGGPAAARAGGGGGGRAAHAGGGGRGGGAARGGGGGGGRRR